MGNITELSQGNLDGLKKQVCECIEHAQAEGYKRGYTKGKNDGHAQGCNTQSEYDKAKIDEAKQEGYNEGLENAWELIKEIEHNREFEEMVFGESLINDFTNVSVHFAMEKFKTYKENKQAEEEIKVGDEVKHHNKLFIVTHTGTINCSVIDSDGRTGAFSKVVLEKTGKNVADKLQALFDDKAKGVEE